MANETGFEGGFRLDQFLRRQALFSAAAKMQRSQSKQKKAEDTAAKVLVEAGHLKRYDRVLNERTSEFHLLIRK